MPEFIVGYRVKNGFQWTEWQHTGDRLGGLPWDLEDIELGEDVRAALFRENVLGWPDYLDDHPATA